MPTPDKIKQHELIQAAQIEKFALTLQKLLEVNLAKTASKINFKTGNVSELIKTILRLEQLIKDEKLNIELEKIKNIYANELQFIRQNFDYYKIPLEFTEQDKEIIKGIIAIDTDSVKNNIDNWIIDIRTSLVTNAILKTVPDLDQLSEKYGDKLANQIRTEINTATSMFNGQVSLNKAKEVLGNDPLMLYMGVLDNLTRPFCRKHVGKTYRLSEVKKMDNGQSLDVVTAKGGYNCRHVWLYVTDDYVQ